MMDEVNPIKNEHDLVRECLTEIFKLNGYDDVSKLTQRDYEHVSSTIEAKTTILISVSTLKRLLHGEFTRIPQTATLNAISTYLGHKSWQDFKLSIRKKSVSTVTKEPIRHEVKVQTENVTPRSKIKRITVVSVGVICVVIAVLFIRYAPGKSTVNFDKASF